MAYTYHPHQKSPDDVPNGPTREYIHIIVEVQKFTIYLYSYALNHCINLHNMVLHGNGKISTYEYIWSTWAV